MPAPGRPVSARPHVLDRRGRFTQEREPATATTSPCCHRSAVETDGEGSDGGDGSNVVSCNPSFGAVDEKQDAVLVIPQNQALQQSVGSEQHRLPLFHRWSVKWDCEHWPPAFCVVGFAVSDLECNLRHTFPSLGRIPSRSPTVRVMTFTNYGGSSWCPRPSPARFASPLAQGS